MSRPSSKPFDFNRAVGAYVVVAVLLALVIHFVVMRAPRYRWIVAPPVRPASGASPIVPASPVR